MANRNNVATQEEFTNEYIKETRIQLNTLINWIEKHKNATFEYCKKVFGKENFTNVFHDETGRDYWFDMNYGNMCITLVRGGKKDQLHIQDGIELYSDDITGCGGDFDYDKEYVEQLLKREFKLYFYSV